MDGFLALSRVAARVTMRAAIPAVLALAILALAIAPTASAKLGLPDALTERGETVEEIYVIITVLGLIIFAIVFVWLVLVIWRFRETTGHGRATHERERHSLKAELAWFLIPLAIVLYIGGIAYAGLVELDHGISVSEVDPENHVRIEGSQWNWAAKYPGGVTVTSDPDPTSGAVKNESMFYIPADTPILFNVTATDVIHAFQVLDANHGFVIFVDANPLGANKYNLQTARFPEGEYYIQCNKMCLNPGHAYMRARIKAVPQADFDLWHSEKAAVAGASPSLTQFVPLTSSGGNVLGADGQPVPPLTVVAGTRVVLRLDSPAQDVTFSVSSPGDAEVAATKTIRAGEAADPFFAFTAKVADADYTVMAGGSEILVKAIRAEMLTVELGAFRLIPDHLDLKAGETYLITLTNTHATVHDLYIGHLNGGGASSEVIANSQSVGPAGSGTFRVTMPAAGQFEMWCNQAGHVGQGMVGTVTVS